MRLADYDAVVVNSSAGKDSQTALRQVMLLARKQDYPAEQITVSHQDLGECEWANTKELAQKQAEYYGLTFRVSRYRTKHHEEIDLLEYIRRRGFWPSNKQRFCTSDFKRGPGGRILTVVAREARERTGKKQAKVLQIFGFRAEESPSRKKKEPLRISTRASRGNMEVTDWLPIHQWELGRVWHDIKASGVDHHPAYDLGMPRLSCSFCIFAPRAALMIAGKARPDMLEQYVQLEKEIGHDFVYKKPLADIQKAILAGEEVNLEDIKGAWNM